MKTLNRALASCSALALAIASPATFAQAPNAQSVQIDASKLTKGTLGLGLLPHVANNSTLATLKTFVTVNREGFYTAGDAPPMEFYHVTSGCGAPDNGSQVTASDGGCWYASVPHGGTMDAREFGALCNNSNGGDDGPALNLALASGIRVSIPAGRSCYAATTVQMPTGTELLGPGIITGALSLTPIVQVGTSSVGSNYAYLHDTRITRAPGTIPAGSVGLSLPNFGYFHEVNLRVDRSDIGRAADNPSTTGAVSIGYVADNPRADNAISGYVKLNNVADVHFNTPYFGINGIEATNTACHFIISGAMNALDVDGGTLISNGPTANSITDFCYKGAANANTIVKVRGLLTENYANVVSSDGATPALGELTFSGGHYGGTATSQFFALNAATSVTSLIMDGVEDGSAFTITSPFKWSSITASIIGGLTSIAGQSGSDFTTAGSTYLGKVAISGAFNSLVFQSGLANGATLADTSQATTKNMSYAGISVNQVTLPVAVTTPIATPIQSGEILVRDLSNSNVGKYLLSGTTATLEAPASGEFTTTPGSGMSVSYSTSAPVGFIFYNSTGSATSVRVTPTAN